MVVDCLRKVRSENPLAEFLNNEVIIVSAPFLFSNYDILSKHFIEVFNTEMKLFFMYIKLIKRKREYLNGINFRGY